MPISPRTRMWLVIVGVAVVSAILAGGAVWLSQQVTIDGLTHQVAANERAIADLESQVRDLEAQLAASEATPTASEEPSATPTSKTTVAVQFTFIRQVNRSSGATRLLADYAQMLTGVEAAAAATAHGDESPPPNDYYIVNDNPRLRRLDVDPDAEVRLTTKEDGTVEPGGYAVTLERFAEIFQSTQAVRDAPFWLTITGDVVTAIKQQYLP